MILRGELGKTEEWDVMVDLFFYKKIEDVEEQINEDKEEGDKHATKEGRKWDNQQEEAEGDEEQWAA